MSSFDLQAGQNDKGTLQIEFLDENGIACSRLELTQDGVFRAKGGSRFANMMKYEAGKNYHVEAVLSTADRNIQVYVDGKRVGTEDVLCSGGKYRKNSFPYRHATYIPDSWILRPTRHTICPVPVNRSRWPNIV